VCAGALSTTDCRLLAVGGPNSFFDTASAAAKCRRRRFDRDPDPGPPHALGTGEAGWVSVCVPPMENRTAAAAAAASAAKTLPNYSAVQLFLRNQRK